MVIGTLNRNMHNLMKNYVSYIITIITLFTLELVTATDEFIETGDIFNSLDIILHSFEVIFFLVMYIFMDIKLKKVISNKKIKILFNACVTAIICAFLEINISIFITRDVSFITDSSAIAYSNLLKIFFGEFIEIIIYLYVAVIIEYIINKFLLSNYSLREAGFIANIPEHKRKDIYLIQSSENYIAVYYEDDSEKHTLINYRFSNAVKEIDSDLGLQVHRSYWVSVDSIKTLKRVNNKYYITAKNGQQIPVSQTYIQAVKALKKSL